MILKLEMDIFLRFYYIENYNWGLEFYALYVPNRRAFCCQYQFLEKRLPYCTAIRTKFEKRIAPWNITLIFPFLFKTIHNTAFLPILDRDRTVSTREYFCVFKRFLTVLTIK